MKPKYIVETRHALSLLIKIPNFGLGEYLKAPLWFPRGAWERGQARSERLRPPQCV